MTPSTSTPSPRSVRACCLDGPEGLLARLRDRSRELALLDVREEGQFGLGHLLWAVNAPYSCFESVLPAFVPRLDCPLVLLDANDGVAHRAARRAQALGYRDVAVLDGGVPAWERAGHPLFKGVYVPGKVLGEWVDHRYATPFIDAQTLHGLQSDGAPVLVLDPRTEAEHAARHVPGAASCPNGELLYRFEALAPPPETLVVVACGGRTRGIVGAQTLIDAGVPHRVVALEDGNHGWQLAGLPLETGLRHRAPAPDAAQLRRASERAAALALRHGVPIIRHGQWLAWREDARRTSYLIDVRSPEEFAAGHLDGARNAPGGQLIQASDRWLGTLHARVVLADTDGVRAVQAAHWLRRLGWEAYALEPAGGAEVSVAPGPTGASAAHVSADRAARVEAAVGDVPRYAPEIDPVAALALCRQGALPVCVERSDAFLVERPTGAIWANRARLDRLHPALREGRPLLLFSDDGRLAQLAAVDLLESSPRTPVHVVRGGQTAWVAAGLPMESGHAGDLPDEDRIDFLFWAHDRRRGNAQAMRAYLAWEKQLVAQAAQEPAGFPLGQHSFDFPAP